MCAATLKPSLARATLYRPRRTWRTHPLDFFFCLCRAALPGSLARPLLPCTRHLPYPSAWTSCVNHLGEHLRVQGRVGLQGSHPSPRATLYPPPVTLAAGHCSRVGELSAYGSVRLRSRVGLPALGHDTSTHCGLGGSLSRRAYPVPCPAATTRAAFQGRSLQGSQCPATG